MTRDRLAQADRTAREQWKAAFFAAYDALGTPAQAVAVKRLKKRATAYARINRRALEHGVAYDPRKRGADV